MRSSRFFGHDALTYSYNSELSPGTIVTVPLRQETALGIIAQEVRKPDFTTKPLSSVLPDICVPKASLELLHWMKTYYPAPLGLLTQLFLPVGLLKTKLKSPVSLTKALTNEGLQTLTKEQTAAVKKITASNSLAAVLDGITGSGKTRIYMELAAQSLGSGRSVVVLTPEISLTPQLAASFKRHFSSPVINIHSHLTEGERRDVWLQCALATEPVVVIGPRSALFSPLKNIGLIVVDEAHEAAYKQEQAPYYYALRVASKLAQLHKSRLILGSATLPVTEYYLAEKKRVPIVRLDKLALPGKNKTTVEVVDLRDRGQFSRQYYLSDQLLQKIREALGRKQQALVFLNRRGTARLVLCQICGWQVLCPRCDIPMTYHGDSHILNCHTCGQTSTPPSVCENCGSNQILFKSIGTKAVVEALQKEFPKARIQRFDTDNLKAERFEQHYEAVRSGEVDILVGTQQLAKGLDLPLLSVVGVVLADSSLYFPDYTAEENTYQLLTQVIGRIGRGHIDHADAIIQTYHPESPAITAAVGKNWPDFYASQLKERQTFLFPPFCFTLKLRCERASSVSAKQAAEKLLEHLRITPHKVQFVGPSPSFREKTAGKYTWQIIAKSKDRSELLKLISLLPSGTFYDIDPMTLL